MEFLILEEFLKTGITLQNGDYVFEHNKEGYPLRSELDVNDLYLITTTNGHKLSVLSFASVERELDLEKISGYWWVLKLPSSSRKSLGMQ